VADLGEARWQDVQQEAANEFERCQGLGVAVFGVKGDSVVIDGDDTLVGDTDPVGMIFSAGTTMSSSRADSPPQRPGCRWSPG
jgi:hypothetical protein